MIDETIREAGRASFPLEDALMADIVQAAQLHVDETSWPESGVLLWLWALVTTHTVLFLIGPRSREMLENALQDGYPGILISDGYVVYRAWENRLRYWPHLLRKLRGLAESSDGRVSGVGQEMEAIMKNLVAAITRRVSSPRRKGCRYATAPTSRAAAEIVRSTSNGRPPSTAQRRARIPLRLEGHPAPARRAPPAALQQRGRTGAAPLGDFAHHQPRNPLRSEIPRLCSSG